MIGYFRVTVNQLQACFIQYFKNLHFDSKFYLEYYIHLEFSCLHNLRANCLFLKCIRNNFPKFLFAPAHRFE